MKRSKLAAVIFVNVSLLSSATFAHVSLKGEDMPVEVRAPYNWTGFYAGLNAGAVQHTMNITDIQAATFNATIQQVTNPAFTGGFQLGYRHQLDLTKASGVYGLEFSGNFSNATFNSQYGTAFTLYNLSAQNALKNLFLLQLIGGVAAERTLLFLAAGLSWTNITGGMTNLDGVPFFTSLSVNKKVIGTSVGAGIEYAFTDKISARVKLDVITPKAYFTSDNVGNSYQISNSILQGTFGVNYKFG